MWWLYLDWFRDGGIVGSVGVDVPYSSAFGFHSTKVKNILYKKCFMFQLRVSRLQCLEYLYRICVVYCATHRLAHKTMYNNSIA